MKKNKWITAFLTVAAAMSLCAVTTGAQKQEQRILYHAIDGQEVVEARGVEPRFRYFDSISCLMTQTGGISTSTGSALVNTAYKNTLTVAAQRKKNGSWVSVKTRSTENASDFLVVEFDYALTRGNDYRALSTIVVETGAHTEVATCESVTVYY